MQVVYVCVGETVGESKIGSVRHCWLPRDLPQRWLPREESLIPDRDAH